MRYLIISDIHANLVALDAVLDAADEEGYDEIWCLGDVVGYGPNPNECVERMRDLATYCLAGNHDWAALDRIDISDFNPEARIAVEWTREELTPESIEYLDERPPRIDDVIDVFTLAHASPRHPIWEYILYPSTAAENFQHFDTPFCLVGHTHQPIIFRQEPGASDVQALMPALGQPLPIDQGAADGIRFIINPGGVGQPRDGDPRASFVIYDDDAGALFYYRHEYDIAKTQARMREANLPDRLVNRLEYGW